MASKIGELFAEVGVRGIATVKAGLDRVKGMLGGAARAAASIVSPLTLMAGGLNAIGVQSTAVMGRMAADLERVRLQLTTITGSLTTSQALLAKISSIRSPFPKQEMQDTVVALIGMGVKTGDAVAIMQRLGNVATGTGASLSTIAETYLSAAAAGKISTGTLDTLGKVGVPIIAALSKHLGVSERAVVALASEGRIRFKTLNEVMTKLTSDGGQFAGAMDAYGKTIWGSWGAIVANGQMAIATIAEMFIKSSGLASALQAVADYSDQFWAQWGGVFHDMADLVGAVSERIVNVFNWAYGVVSSGIETVAGFFGIKLEEMEGGWLGMVTSWIQGTQFMVENWSLFLEMAIEHVKLFVKNIPARFSAMVTNIGVLLAWLRDNWWDIFKTMGSFVGNVFSNLIENMKRLWTALLGWFAGKGWQMDWKPLTDGFKSSIKEMPQFVEAQVEGSSERLDELTRQLERKAEAFIDRKAKSRAERDAAGAAQGKALGGTGALPKRMTQYSNLAVSFVGFADLAKKMQEEAGKRFAEQTAKATEETATAVKKVAQAADGGALRVQIVGGGGATYA